MAGPTRLELATFRVTGGRSNQLSYDPLKTYSTFQIPWLALTASATGRSLLVCHLKDPNPRGAHII